MKCFYCPISQKRKMVDTPYANERKVSKISDLVYEAERMGAKGAGITGGDPLYRLERTVRFVKALKRKFGKSFHVHFYTTGELGTEKKFKALWNAGVDEIRFHFNRKEILIALKLDWTVGGEIPAIPGNWKATTSYLTFLESAGAKFCNLNELDWSEQNVSAFKKRGFRLKSPGSYAVAGSEEFALRILAWARKNTPNLSVHYCSSRTKDAVQIRKRYLRTAKNVRKPFETIDRDGLLVKAVVESVKKIPEIPEKGQFYNRKKNRVEFSPSIAGKISKKYRVSIVSVAPTADETEMERFPVSPR